MGLEFSRRELEHFLERERVGGLEFAGGDAAQGSDVRAAAELLTQFMRDGADVGPFRAGQPEIAQRAQLAKRLWRKGAGDDIHDIMRGGPRGVVYQNRAIKSGEFLHHRRESKGWRRKSKALRRASNCSRL